MKNYLCRTKEEAVKMANEYSNEVNGTKTKTELEQRMC